MAQQLQLTTCCQVFDFQLFYIRYKQFKTQQAGVQSCHISRYYAQRLATLTQGDTGNEQLSIFVLKTLQHFVNSKSFIYQDFGRINIQYNYVSCCIRCQQWRRIGE